MTIPELETKAKELRKPVFDSFIWFLVGMILTFVAIGVFMFIIYLIDEGLKALQ